MTSTKNLEIICERVIPAPPGEVFDAWLDSKIPGTPFHENEKLIVNPGVDGLWYWLFRGQPHFGRFTEIDRPGELPAFLLLVITSFITYNKSG